MPLATLDAACLAFGHVPLLDRVDLALKAGERVALIGRNGSGKSSLLRVLADAQALDDGAAWRAPGLRVALVSQEPALDPRHTVFEAVAQGAGTVFRLLLDYHRLLHDLAAGAAADGLARLQHLQHELEHADGWRVHARIEAVIERLGLDADAKVETLSGGTLKRVALAQAQSARKAASPPRPVRAAAQQAKLTFKEARELEALPRKISALEARQRAVSGGDV